MKQTPAQILLALHIKELGLYRLFEVTVCEKRKWRFDIACPTERIAFEVNGGKWSGGHRRGKAIEDENDKLNTATLMGWRVLQFTNEQVLDGRAKAFLAEWLKA
jgi:very-short-patch-repair endonuclease